MRYAIVSDIHANLPAWQAVLTDIAHSDVDGIVCLGDLLGYGPHPAQVLESVHARVDAFVMGNHDAVLCGKMPPDRFTPRARQILEWTQRQVAPRAAAFLADQPLVLVADGFRCAHGDFSAPGAFHYVLEAAEALPSWRAVEEPLLFVGHSHLPGIFVIGASGTPHRLDPHDFEMEPGKRYLVNPGSVGFPRDRDARACYCLFDADARTVRWRRVPFDLDAYRDALASAGLPAADVGFLARDPLAALPPIRERLVFAPATRPDEQVRGVRPEQDLARVLRRRVARWRLAALLLALLALAAAAAVLHLRGRPPPDVAFACPAAELAARPAAAAAAADANLLPPIPSGFEAGVLPGWRYLLADRRRQSVAPAPGTNGPALRASSALPGGRIRIEAAPADVGGTGVRRLCMSARMRPGDGFAGVLTLSLDMVCEDADGRRTPHLRREEKDFRSRDGEWLAARRTFDLLKDARYVTVAVEGAFTGAVDIAGIALTPAGRR